MFVYTIQPLSNRFHNRFDNRLYRVNGAYQGAEDGHSAYRHSSTVPNVHRTSRPLYELDAVFVTALKRPEPAHTSSICDTAVFCLQIGIRRLTVYRDSCDGRARRNRQQLRAAVTLRT